MDENGLCVTNDYVEGGDVWGFIYAMISLSCVLMIILSNMFILFSCAYVPEDEPANSSE